MQRDPTFNNEKLKRLVADSTLATQLLQHHGTLRQAVLRVHELESVESPEGRSYEMAQALQFFCCYQFEWVHKKDDWSQVLSQFMDLPRATRINQELLGILTMILVLRKTFTNLIEPCVYLNVDFALALGCGGKTLQKEAIGKITKIALDVPDSSERAELSQELLKAMSKKMNTTDLIAKLNALIAEE